ncbi:hypothetical protein ACFL5A_01585 [Gemmatimonadota bacterium]
MSTRRVVKRERTRVPEYTCLGCPMTKSRSLWCHRMCVPKNGLGVCGRVAPHAVVGKTAEAILRYKTRQLQEQVA